MVLAMMRGMKNNALALSLKKYINDKFSDIGEVLECTLDTQAGELELKLRLSGETASVTLNLDRYEIVK